MKRILHFILVIIMVIAPLRAVAVTDSLILANGSATESHVPVYGSYASEVQHTQSLYPASMLAPMVGENIVGLRYFVTGNWSIPHATVRLAVVSDTILLGFDDSASFVQVWNGPLTGGIDIQFAAAFPYSGGNLLVDIQTLNGGSYASSTSPGITRTGASCYCYDAYGFSTTSCDFLPKAMFAYTSDVFCSAPTNVSLVSSTDQSITVSWSPGGIESAWEVMVDDSVMATAIDTFATVYGLSPSTQYAVKVRAICGPGDSSSWSDAALVATQCGIIATLPWSYSFEGVPDNGLPVCWSRTPIVYNNIFSGGTVSAPYVTTSRGRTGTNSLYLGWMTYYPLTNAGPAVVATPMVVSDPTNLHVAFYSRGQLDAGCTLEAGIMTDPTDNTTFVPVLTLVGNDLPSAYDAPFTVFDFYTSTLTGLNPTDMVCIAFRMTIGSSAQLYEVYIDDVTIEVPSLCEAPRENTGVVDSVSYEAVQLTWQSRSMPDAFDVKLVNTVSNVVTHHTALDTTVLITGLGSDTTYEAYVASVCGSDTTAYTLLGTFHTHKRCYAVSGVTCSAITANAAMLTWHFNPNGIPHSTVEIVLVDVDDSTVSVYYAANTDVYVFTDLNEGHTYQATLRTICGDYDTATSVAVQFVPHSSPCAEVAGTGISQSLPFNSYYKYGFSESLYDASIVEGVDSITGIALEVAQALNRNSLVDIYMGYTTLNSLTGAAAYVPVSQLTQVVANYQLSTASVGWTDTIPFTMAFHPQPSGDSLNLVIAFFNHTGSYTSGLRWRTHTSTIGNSCYRNTDNSITAASPWGSNAGATNGDAPNIKLFGSCGGTGCVAPSVSVTHADTDAVTLVWLPGGSESSWTVQYRPNGASDWAVAGTTTTLPYTVAGLNPGTNYLFRLGSICGDTVVYSPAVNASTQCGYMHAPFSIIPNGSNHCWTFAGNGAFSTSYNNYYIYSNGSIVTPFLADSVSNLQLKLRGYGYTYYVGVMESTGNITWVDTVNFTSGSYEVKKTYFTNYTGGGNRIVIQATASSSRIYISNIAIQPRDLCVPPTGLTVDSVGTTEAWLSWQSDNDSFMVRYRAENDTTGTWHVANFTAPAAHLTGLSPNDYYHVEVYSTCGSDGASDSITAAFATGCVSFTTPFAEHFLRQGLPLCWSTSTSGQVDESWEESAEYGDGYVFSYAGYYGNGTASDWLMTPVIQLPADTRGYQLIYRCSGGPDGYYGTSLAKYEVRLSTSGSGNTADYTTVLLTDTVNSLSGSTLNFIDRHLSLAAYGGQAVSFAFRNTSRMAAVVAISDVEVRDAASPAYDVTGDNIAYVGEPNYYYARYQEGMLDSMTTVWTSAMAAAGQAVISVSGDTMSIVYTAEGTDTVNFVAANGYGTYTTSLIVNVYDCSPVRTFPFTESFEADEAPAGCWTLLYGNNTPTRNPMLHTATVNNYLPGIPDGDQVFRFSSYSSTTDYSQYLISRELGGEDMVLSFQYAKHNSHVEQLRVGYSSTGRDTASFTWRPWIADTAISYNQWHQYTDSIPDGTRFVALHYNTNRGYYVYIDNLEITGVPACMAPVIDSVVRGEDNLVVNYTSVADSVEVIVTDGAFSPNDIGVVATASPYIATGLTHSTAYIIAVRSLCDGGRRSDWTIVTDSTLAIDCVPPTGLTVLGTGYYSVELGWTPQGDESAWQLEAYNTVGSTLHTATTNPYTFEGLTPGVSAYVPSVAKVATRLAPGATHCKLLPISARL